jgi:uncharacterized membrane protein (DUF2068 family)
MKKRAKKNQHSEPIGLRLVAAFEATKGLLVLAIGTRLISPEGFARHLHLNPLHMLARLFLNAQDHLSKFDPKVLLITSIVYCTVRLAEAYGLWFARVWAEWFAIISCAAYLPIEFYEVARSASLLKVLITVGNLILLIYLIVTRMRSKHPLHQE